MSVGLAAATLVVAGASIAGTTIAAPAVGAGPQLGPFQLVPPSGGADAAYGGTLSADGRFIAFRGKAGVEPAQVYVWDQQESTTTLVSATPAGEPGNLDSRVTSITLGGRHVLFTSEASNLVPDDSNGVKDAFVRDLRTGTTRMVSVSSSGSQLGKESYATSMTPDGQVAFFQTPSKTVPDDRNGVSDVYAHNLLTGRTKLVSRNSRGQPGNQYSGGAAVSDNGNWVAFESGATNLARGDRSTQKSVFLRNRSTGRTRLVSVWPGGGPLNVPQTPFPAQADLSGISGDGRVVAFTAFLAGGQGRGFVFQQATGTTRTVLKGRAQRSFHYVDVNSLHGDLVTVTSWEDLTNQENSGETQDVYALRLSTGKLTWLTAQDPPVEPHSIHSAALSRNAKSLLAYTRDALTAEDTNDTWDLYLREITW